MSFRIGRARYNSINMPIHKHDFYEIVCFVSGEGQSVVQGQFINVKKGDVLIVPPYIDHSSMSDDGLQSVYISGPTNLLSLTNPEVVRCDDEEALFLANAIYNNRYKGGEYLNMLCKALIEYLMQRIEIPDAISIAVNRIVKSITTNSYDASFNLNKLLNNSGYAEDYIRAHFKKIVGKTPVEFLTEVRIEHAKQLIDTYKDALLLYEVAILSGFSDYVYFSRRFKKFTGLSPQEYKNSK